MICGPSTGRVGNRTTLLGEFPSTRNIGVEASSNCLEYHLARARLGRKTAIAAVFMRILFLGKYLDDSVFPLKLYCFLMLHGEQDVAMEAVQDGRVPAAAELQPFVTYVVRPNDLSSRQLAHRIFHSFHRGLNRKMCVLRHLFDGIDDRVVDRGRGSVQLCFKLRLPPLQVSLLVLQQLIICS